jgi:sulfonate transport system permease protein
MTGRPAAPVRGLLPLAILIGGWQLLGDDTSVAFPPPSAWWRALAGMHGDGVLLPAFGRTLSTYAMGLLAAAAGGAVVGIAVGTWPRLDRALSPTLNALAAVPAAVYVPLAVLLLGTTPLTAVAIVALAVAWPIMLDTAAAVRAVPPVRLEAARTLGLSPAHRWRAVLVPSLAPGFLLGLRVASAMALIVTLLAEIVGAGSGVGRLLVERQQSFDAAGAWGLLAAVGVIGYATSTLLARLEVAMLPVWGVH